MSKIKTILRGGALSALLTILVSVPTFADACRAGQDAGGEYAGLYIAAPATVAPSDDYPIKCSGANMQIDGATHAIFAKTTAGCAKAASLAANPEGCTGTGLNTTIQTIINMIIFLIGIVAVVMVIIGGINYSTSQGDPGKVKKAKDTIMYGIIGLVVAVLAFAIVNFVLTNIAG